MGRWWCGELQQWLWERHEVRPAGNALTGCMVAGIGVACALALLDLPPTAKLPPLECLFTVDEETGLTGAAGGLEVSSRDIDWWLATVQANPVVQALRDVHAVWVLDVA